MMRLRSIAGDERGATIVEFAFVAPVLVLTLLGLFDLGYKSYVSSVLQGALHEAARLATVGNKTDAQLDTNTRARLRDFSRGSTIAIARKSYADFDGVEVPEVITSDTAPFGSYNSGDCYQDANNNNSYDLDRGAAGGGQSEDAIHYQVTITYPRLFPLGSLMGLPTTETVRSSTLLRNQPYGSRNTGIVVRC